MRIVDNQDWIEIKFICYATDASYRLSNLLDEKNCVEIDFDFEIAEVGWGCVGDEYFKTFDMQALADGFRKILDDESGEFIYSGDFPYGSSLQIPFYTFFVKRNKDNIDFKLEIHDTLMDYISVTEIMSISRYKEIVYEFLDATKEFPPR